MKFSGTMAYRTTCAAALLFLMSTATAAKAEIYSIGTLAPGSLTYRLAVAIGEASNKAGATIRVQSFGGNAQIVGLVENGEVAFGFANVQELDWAAKGIETFEGRQAVKLRAVAAVLPLRGALVVPASSPVQKVADLKGMRLPSEYTAMPMIRTVQNALLANGGLSMKDVTPVPVANLIQSYDELAAGRLDAVYGAAGIPKLIEIDNKLGGLRMIPVDDSPEAFEALQAFLPYASIAQIEPGPRIVGVDKPINIIRYDYVMFANADVPDQVAYDMAKLLAEGSAGLIAETKLKHGFQRDQLAKKLSIPFHPGAEAYYREAGMWPQE